MIKIEYSYKFVSMVLFPANTFVLLLFFIGFGEACSI